MDNLYEAKKESFEKLKEYIVEFCVVLVKKKVKKTTPAATILCNSMGAGTMDSILISGQKREKLSLSQFTFQLLEYSFPCLAHSRRNKRRISQLHACYLVIQIKSLFIILVGTFLVVLTMI